MSPSDVIGEQEHASLSDELVIHVLNIGAGSCQIVQCPHSHRVLVMDCGSSGASGDDLVGAHIVNHAQANGLFSHPETEILVAISHPDQDHTNKIPLLLESHSVQSIWLGGVYDEYTGPIGGFLDQADQTGVTINHGWPPNFHNRGHPIEGLQCGSANTYILTVNTEGSRNAQSMVLLLDYGDYRGIFAGDAEQETEEAAYQAYGALMEDTTVLVASHHGAHTHGSNHEAWLTATNPQIVVFSAGNRYGHPRQEIVERYQVVQDATVATHRLRWGLNKTEYEEDLTTQKPVYVTKENGAIVIRTNGRTVQVECSLESECY
jgi:competence protein ComEC